MDEVNHVNRCLAFGFACDVMYVEFLTMFNVGCMGYEWYFQLCEVYGIYCNKVLILFLLKS